MLSNCDLEEEDQIKREKREAQDNFQRQYQANSKSKSHAKESLPDLALPVGKMPMPYSLSNSDTPLGREISSMSDRPSGTDFTSVSGEYSGNLSSIHSSTVDKLLDSIGNSVDDIIQREGGSRPNIVGPELGNGLKLSYQIFLKSHHFNLNIFY